MNKNEQAKIIMQHLENYIQIDHNFEKFYIKGIVEGLMEIDKLDKDE